MKRFRRLMIWAVLLVLVGSCFFPSEPSYPPLEPWLCSINADGTGFRKIIKATFDTPGLADIYMTKDDRIIFYGEKLWISDTDVIEPVQITPDNLICFVKPQLEFTKDGGTVYFAASRDLYKLKLSTIEVFKLTETPDYYYAEPSLSDNERFLATRSYVGKNDKSQPVYGYLDLTDNSSHIAYSNNYVGGTYKGRIFEGMNRLFLENINGLGSVCLEDSIYTLHLAYSASFKNMLETSPDQRYLFSRYLQGAKSYAIAIDLNDFSCYELGRIYDSETSNPIKSCKSANLVYLRDEQHIYKYDPNTQIKSTIFASNSNVEVDVIYMHAPTWDGNKVYFYASVYEGEGNE